MWNESRFNPAIQNSVTKAVGLIQFLPETNKYSILKQWGVTAGYIASLSNVQQLDYVYKYFLPAKGKIKTFEDLYLFTFFPVALGKGTSFVMQAQGVSASAVSASNPSLDLHHDGKITVAEFYNVVKNRMPQAVKDIIYPASFGLFGIVLIVGIAYYFLTRKNKTNNENI